MQDDGQPPHLSYRKVRSTDIFQELDSIADLGQAQLYCPLHKRLFALTQTTADLVTIDSPKKIQGLISRDGENDFTISVVGNGPNVQSHVAPSFVKFSPLLDPLKHVTGGYSNTDLSTLPDFTGTEATHPKVERTNNSSYVDAAASAACALLRSCTGLPNLIDFYGYFVGVKRGYRYMITDDIDVAYHSQFFSDNTGSLFNLEGSIPSRTDSLSHKPRLSIGECAVLTDVEVSTQNTDLFSGLASTSPYPALTAETLVLVNHEADLSDVSSDEDNTDDEACASPGSPASLGSHDLSEEECLSDGSYSDEEETYCRMASFPCTAIFLEKLQGTLESLTADADLTDDEWTAALFQVTITLAYLQRTLNLTHNDLHTSNIMYSNTESKYLFYKFGGRHYRVPTYGRIFKIIDFGRCIFEYRGQRFASDSFEKGEDAAGQYNCSPFLDHTKPELLPNRSFDLCRLGCSLFDYFFQSVDESREPATPLEKFIVRLCTDGGGKNLLYKSDGEERYPGFKLYKMISRRCEGLEPERVILTEPIFKQYLSSRKQLGKKTSYDLDSGPRLSQDIQIRTQAHS